MDWVTGRAYVNPLYPFSSSLEVKFNVLIV